MSLATYAIVNLTPVEANTPGNGQLIGSGVGVPPVASNVNFGPGSVDPNVAVTPIGPDGQVCYVNSEHTNVHLVADHLATINAGYFVPGSSNGGSVRRIDTRSGLGGGKIAPSGHVCFSGGGRWGEFAVVNLTPVEATGLGNGQLVPSDVVDPPVRVERELRAGDGRPERGDRPDGPRRERVLRQQHARLRAPGRRPARHVAVDLVPDGGHGQAHRSACSTRGRQGRRERWDRPAACASPSRGARVTSRWSTSPRSKRKVSATASSSRRTSRPHPSLRT